MHLRGFRVEASANEYYPFTESCSLSLEVQKLKCALNHSFVNLKPRYYQRLTVSLSVPELAGSGKALGMKSQQLQLPIGRQLIAMEGCLFLCVCMPPP